MSEIYYAMLVFPLIFNVTLLFIFSTSLTDIIQYQTIMNCPFPINSGIAVLGDQNFPNINYTTTFDNDTNAYHVTVFECEFDPTSESPSINTRIYTGSNNWYDVTGRASGYLFYLSEIVDTIGVRINAFGGLLYVMLFPVAQVSGLSFFVYIQIVLYTLVAFGAFMVGRGA